MYAERKAAAFLRFVLVNGAKPGRYVVDVACWHDISPDDLDTAARAIGIETRRHDTDTRTQMWALSREDWRAASEPFMQAAKASR